MVGLNRLVRKGASRFGSRIDSPPFNGELALGVSSERVNDFVAESLLHYYIRVQAQHGDPFELGVKIKPFDVFMFDLMVKAAQPDLIVHGSISGLLYKKPITALGVTNSFFGVFQNFDFYGKRIEELAEMEDPVAVENRSSDFYALQKSAYKVGATSIGGGVYSKYALFPDVELKALVQLIGIPMGGLNSEYTAESGRLYLLGPGWGVKFYGHLKLAKYAALTVTTNIFRITSASDYQGQENARIMTAGIRIPLGRNMS